MEKKNLFIDMDGVLVEWREDQTAKDTYRKGYFENLRPYSNVVGAVNAVSCANMALAGVDYAIPCDEVIDAMGRVGSLLSPDLRETGQGGLAATPTGVRIAERLAEEA